MLHHQWAEDFGAARSTSVAPATGEWVLILDADERLIHRDGCRLAALLTNPTAPMYSLHLSNVVGGQVTQSDFLGRIVRNHPDLRFTGVLHEQPTMPGGTDNRASERPELPTLDPAEARLIHLGAAPAIVARKDKRRRNDAILARMLREHPDDPHTWLCAVVELEAEGRVAEAIPYHVRMLRQSAEQGAPARQLLDDAGALARSLRTAAGRYAESLQWCEWVLGKVAAQETPDYAAVVFERGAALLGLEDHAQATAHRSWSLGCGV